MATAVPMTKGNKTARRIRCNILLSLLLLPSFLPRGPTNHGRPIKAVKFRPSVSHGTFVPSVYIARRTGRERGGRWREEEGARRRKRGAVYQRKLPTRSPVRLSALKWLRWEAMNRRSNGSFLFPFRHPKAAGAYGAAIAVSAQDAGTEG